MNVVVRHIRFATLPAIALVTVATFFAGHIWLYLGTGLLVACWLLDIAGVDDSEPTECSNPLFVEATLYSGIPVTMLLALGLVLFAAAPDTLCARMGEVIGITHTEPRSVLEFAGAVLSVGLIGGTIAGAFGHELMHRSTRSEWALGQMLLAHCLYTPFAIEHVYGHHAWVGTPMDHASVRRGQSFWRYLPGAIASTYRGAARFEALRMRRHGRPWFASANRFLQGLTLEVLIAAAILAAAGVDGLAAFLASAAIGILIIELSNYIAHYGLVRVPGRKLQPRHSWNAPRFVTTSLTLNLTRHAHHHADGAKQYWKLRVLDDAPIYPLGMGIMEGIALLPPIWFRCVNPLLEEWDRRLASAEELELLREARTTQREHAMLERVSGFGPRVRRSARLMLLQGKHRRLHPGVARRSP